MSDMVRIIHSAYSRYFFGIQRKISHLKVHVKNMGSVPPIPVMHRAAFGHFEMRICVTL
ncbi:hypothetical protein KsCSTR_44550 [Candidatus Kuenenia stuttgartiensis]|uniref:Uncharacterized protein n=1 Tax=Kuenenia stuttgartiensis TaxID=174633 RepID=Q1PWW5_KUEST|nr:hypothetical protein KsCSTR_44550 [Candidatus Kuenenia stuttgartiensis]CAJ71725.1 unknown protein [Candidatus Kuenenia stuttgartiensis]